MKVVVHADEACLGNGRDGATPGGAGGLVEVWRADGVTRRDYWLSEPDTTNNRMALRSAIAAIELLSARGAPPPFRFVSDSEYLVKGMNAWMAGWKRRGWRNVKNPELWQRLDALAAGLAIEWRWVRGHADHPRNEYADFLATRAAREQSASGALVESGFVGWLKERQAAGRFAGVDPEAPG